MACSNSSKEMYLRKVYIAPIAERFAVEEEGNLLENSFNIGDGGDGDVAESKPISGAFTFEGDSEDMNSSQIWHD
jgi:hypothetical protein